MKYNEIDPVKSSDQRPTTIVIDCTYGEKYTFIHAAKKEKQKLVQWSLDALNNAANKKNKSIEI